MNSVDPPHIKLATTVDTLKSCQVAWRPKLVMKNVILDTKNGEVRYDELDILNIPTNLHEKLQCFPLDVKNDIIIRLDNEAYPIQEDFQNIVTCFKKEAVMCGYKLNSNGARNNVKRLYCNHGDVYKDKSHEKRYNVDPRESPQRRNVSISADRRNNRPGGKKEGRYTSTSKTLNNRCCFAFGITYDDKSYIFRPPASAKASEHTGHSFVLPNATALRKSEIGPEEERRMLEDASVAASTKITVRALNSMSGPQRPIAPYSLVREFRASNILQTHLHGNRILMDKSKSFMDLGLEYLRSKNARIVYLASYPKITGKMLEQRTDSSVSRDMLNDLVCSRPTNIAMQKFVVSFNSSKLGLVVESGDIMSMLRVKEVLTWSSFTKVITAGDYLYSVNGVLVGQMTVFKFQSYLLTLSPSGTKKMVVYRRENEDVGDVSNYLYHHKDDILLCDVDSLKTPDNAPIQRKDEFLSDSASVEVQTLIENMVVKNDKSPVFTEEMLGSLRKFVYDYRSGDPSKKELSCNLFVSIGWLLPCQLNLSMLCSYCIFLDSTHNVTIHENFKQFSVCVKDSSGHTYTVCRIGVPHEKNYMLSYILQVCLPGLFGPYFCMRVRRIISDGDIWLCGAIDRAISTIYRKASRGRCGFHLVTIGFERNCKGKIRYYDSFPDILRTEFERMIQLWLYSWMKPGVFTREEYELSKLTLLQWLRSDEVVTNICDQASVDLLVQWIEVGVITHEEHYVFHTRVDLFALDSYTNCGIEGTHNGIKNSSIKVGKQDELHEYIKKTTDYDESRLRDHYVQASNAFFGTKLYGENWKNGLTGKGAKFAYNSMRRSELYVSEVKKLEDDSMVVLVMIGKPAEGDDQDMEEEHEDTVSTPMPAVLKRSEKIDINDAGYTYRLPRLLRYHHAWVVKIVQDSESGNYYLVCSCMNYSRCGLLCTHMHHVHHYYFRKKGLVESIDYHDYHVIWWKCCDYLVRKPMEDMDDKEKDLLISFLHLADDDKRLGLNLRLCEGIQIDDCLQEETTLLKGTEVKFSNCIEPSKVWSMRAVHRMIGWKGDELYHGQNMEQKGLLPVPIVEDNLRCRDLDLRVDEACSHQQCRQELVRGLYDIVDKVDFSKCPDFYKEVSTALNDLHSKAVRINLQGGDDIGTNESRHPSVLERTGFLATKSVQGTVFASKRKRTTKKRNSDVLSP